MLLDDRQTAVDVLDAPTTTRRNHPMPVRTPGTDRPAPAPQPGTLPQAPATPQAPPTTSPAPAVSQAAPTSPAPPASPTSPRTPAAPRPQPSSLDPDSLRIADLRQPLPPAPAPGVRDLLAPVLDRPLWRVEQPPLPPTVDLLALHRAELEADYVAPPPTSAGDEPPIPTRFAAGLTVVPHIEFPP